MRVTGLRRFTINNNNIIVSNNNIINVMQVNTAINKLRLQQNIFNYVPIGSGPER